MSGPGTYVVSPKVTPDQFLLVGPVPLIFPPPDVPLKVYSRPIDQWIIRAAENNTFTVFTGRGYPNDYKWVIKNDTDLYVSSVSPPDSFRVESAGNGLFTIGLFGKNAVLTVGDENEQPRLTFRPANGSDAQCFQFIRVNRD